MTDEVTWSWVICTSEDEGKTWVVHGVRNKGTPAEEAIIPQIMEIIHEETGLMVGYWEVDFKPRVGEILQGIDRNRLH